MKDTRISIRLNENEHEKLKILSIRRRQSIQQIMLNYIKQILEEDNKNEKN